MNSEILGASAAAAAAAARPADPHLSQTLSRAPDGESLCRASDPDGFIRSSIETWMHGVQKLVVLMVMPPKPFLSQMVPKTHCGSLCQLPHKTLFSNRRWQKSKSIAFLVRGSGVGGRQTMKNPAESPSSLPRGWVAVSKRSSFVLNEACCLFPIEVLASRLFRSFCRYVPLPEH